MCNSFVASAALDTPGDAPCRSIVTGKFCAMYRPTYLPGTTALTIILIATSAQAQQTISTVPPVPAKSTPATDHAANPTGNETIIVTGTHDIGRTARDSASPVSVVSAATLRRSGQLNLSDALARTYPSINVPTMGNDASSLTSSITMRVLNPNEVLVLVDGKRRHTTANISVDAGPAFGSTPVDLNMIPAAMIDHIEVLEDGAAAMYGSDAVAGVINIITRKADHGVNLSAQTGANAYNGDGWNTQLGGNAGFGFGNDGYIQLSGQYYHTDHMVAYAEDHRLLPSAPAGSNTSLYTGPVRVPTDSNHVTSSPEETRENFGVNFGKTLVEGIEGFGQITYAHRHGESYENYRVPSTVPAYYPYGFSPLETLDENDYATTLGLKGDSLLGFNWSLSTTYGADEDDVGLKNTINSGLLSSQCVSLLTSPNSTSPYASSSGCGASDTTVRAESYRLAQWTNNFDLRRNLTIGQILPFTLAMGAEHRLETYHIDAGDPQSYQAGGTAGYVGLEPADAGSWSRNVYAGYVDTDLHLTRRWEVDLAGRFEHYTDTGNTENGKISTRYAVTPQIALRATLSNGFRAPTLPEQHYSAIAVGATTVSALLPVSSSSAQSLGASPLKPERSTNASAGLVLQPLSNLHIETDVYQINVRDRIIAGGLTNGPAAIGALGQLGFVIPTGITPASVSSYYFANGASTRTQGLDVKADYSLSFRKAGRLLLTAGLDLNRTRVDHTGSTSVNGTSVSLLNALTKSYITTEYPRSKPILNAFWTIGAWDVNVRQSRYGQTTAELAYQDYTPSSATCVSNGKVSALRSSNTCFAQFNNSPRWMTDLEVGYRFNKGLHAAIGANNIFNVRPRMVPEVNNNLGARIYDSNAAAGSIYGGYYFGRLDLSF